MYYIVYFLFWIISLLPLRILYLFSDIIYPIVYYVVRYRRKVVETNLEKSFPEKSYKERSIIERKFYRFFCDIFMETIKEMHFTESQIKKTYDLWKY